jgi:hypothetical protein
MRRDTTFMPENILALPHDRPATGRQPVSLRRLGKRLRISAGWGENISLVSVRNIRGALLLRKTVNAGHADIYIRELKPGKGLLLLEIETTGRRIHFKFVL